MVAEDRLPEKSASRTEKIEQALLRRQPSLTVIIENVHDPHNVNAILRSCDAVGVERVHLLYYIEKPPRLAPVTSSGAYKWLEYERHTSVRACFDEVRSAGFRILATKLEPTAHILYEQDLAGPTAFVIGNEHRGISEEAAALADSLLYVPMMGMAESLNVSVATAVCLFESLRQRREKGMYDVPQLSPEALRSKRVEWLTK
jgi:tRNA (guanosine-2'-O-)-methyltransferase